MGNKDYELETCPFCGGLAQLDLLGYVVCTGCNAHSNIRLSQEAAIEAWNRRASNNGQAH